ncbi:MAG TPA: hypothetical protein DCG75_00975 [Bacteroidales bacterium]|nr:hypothetical protein [Bacteroidales bacterium]
MKTLKQISKIALISLFILTGINNCFAEDIKDKFEKTFKLNKTGEFSFSCYETDLKINTWDKNEVKLTGEIIINGGSSEDQKKLIDAFKNPEISESENSLTIKTDIAKNTFVIGPFKKITLVNGNTIRVDKYKASYTLWIPESVAFNLKSKYNNIDIANLTGALDFNLYEVDLTLAGFKRGNFNMKYSSAQLVKGETAKFDVYECELEIKEINTFSTNTKYSKFNIGTVGMIALGSYEDDFKIQNLIQGITGQAKYSDFNIESNTQVIKMDVYESDIYAKNVKELEYTSKYSTFSAQNINSIKCESLYETKIYAVVVDDFSCKESKYDNISFKTITNSISIVSAYELDMNIESVKQGFKSFKGDFKYGSIKLPLDPSIEFSINFKTTYGNVDFPKNRVKIKIMDFEDSKKSFEGQTSENPACKIEFTAYDTNFDLE